MKRFRFTLQTLADIKKRKEDAVKLRLAQKNREIIAAKDELAGIQGELADLMVSERQRRREMASLSSLRFSVTYRHKLQHDSAAKSNLIEKLTREADAVRQELVAATKETKALQLLKDRRYVEWKREARLREQGFIDDVSQQKYIRTLHAGARALRHATA